MSICSRHQEIKEGCAACHATPHDLFPDWDESVAFAEHVGEMTCECGFVFYRTVDSCPLCNRTYDFVPMTRAEFRSLT